MSLIRDYVVRRQCHLAPLFIAVPMLLAGPLTAEAAADLPNSCVGLARSYLLAGLPYGATTTFLLGVQTDSADTSDEAVQALANFSGAGAGLTLEYPGYPTVAGQLTSGNTGNDHTAVADRGPGPGLFIAPRQGKLEVQLTFGGETLEVTPQGCIGTNLLYGTTGNALITVALGGPPSPTKVAW